MDAGQGLDDHETTSESPRNRGARGKGMTWWSITNRWTRLALALFTIMLLSILLPNYLDSSTSTSTAYDATVKQVIIENRTEGQVRVSEPTTATLDVNITRMYLTRRPSLSVSRDDANGVLRITAKCSPWRLGRCDANIHVKAPSGVFVKATTSRGTLEAHKSLASVEFESKTGKVKLTQCVGSVRAVTTKGPIVGTKIGSLELFLRTKSGAMTLPFSDTPTSVDAESDAGSIKLTVPRSPNAFRVEATSRSGAQLVDVTRDPAAPRTLRAVSNTGSVSVTS